VVAADTEKTLTDKAAAKILLVNLFMILPLCSDNFNINSKRQVTRLILVLMTKYIRSLANRCK